MNIGLFFLWMDYWINKRSNISINEFISSLAAGTLDLLWLRGGVYMTSGRLSRRSELTPVSSHGSTFVYMIPPQNVMPAPVTPGWVHPGCCTGARISLRYEISQRYHVNAKRSHHTVRCEIGLPLDWNGKRMRNVCDFESRVYFINMKCTFK